MPRSFIIVQVVCLSQYRIVVRRVIFAYLCSRDVCLSIQGDV